MELYAKLAQEFTGEEQQTFVNNFRSYLSYDQNKEYVIDLEYITKLLGFTRKGKAKILLNKYLIENTDYKIALRSDPKRKNEGGFNKETILLSPNAFKELCIRSNTDKSHRIRQYYIKMETILFQHLNEQLTDSNTKLNDNKIEIQSLNDKVKNYEKELLKYKNRIVKKYELGDRVYVIKDITKENIYKVGQTTNLNTRDSAYHSGSLTSKIIYIKNCKDCKLLERLVHSKLKKYKYNHEKEWFEVDFNIIKKTIDESQLFLDEEEGKSTIESDIIEEQPKEKEEQEPVPVLLPKVINKPADYDRFIEECFTLDKNEKSSWLDINARYRLWCRCTDGFKENLEEYITTKGYKKGFIYDEKTKTSSQAYCGIKLIPLPEFTIDENSSDIEKFLNKHFKPLITGRVASKDIFAKYIEWRKESNPDYTILHKNDKKKLNAYLQRRFYGTVVHNGERNRFGFYGLSLIGEQYENIGKRVNLGNRKKIHKINVESNEVVHEYVSVTEAAAKEGISVSAMSTSITNKKVLNGHIYRKSNDIDNTNTPIENVDVDLDTN